MTESDFESAASPNSAISASFFCHSGLDPESSLLCSPAPELRFSVLVKVKDYTRKTPYVNNSPLPRFSNSPMHRIWIACSVRKYI